MEEKALIGMVASVITILITIYKLIKDGNKEIKTKIDSQIGKLETKIDSQRTELKVEMSKMETKLETEMNRRFSEMDKKLDRIDATTETIRGRLDHLIDSWLVRSFPEGSSKIIAAK